MMSMIIWLLFLAINVFIIKVTAEISYGKRNIKWKNALLQYILMIVGWAVFFTVIFLICTLLGITIGLGSLLGIV